MGPRVRAALLSLLLVFGLAGEADSGSMTLLGVGGPAAAGGGGSASYVNRGTFQNDGSIGNTWTQAVNIGTASATRVVAIGIIVQNNPALTVTVNGTSLTQRISSVPSAQYSIWSGVVSSGSGSQNVVIVGANFLVENMIVWTMDGLVSTTPHSTSAPGGGTLTLNVNSGDFIFAVQGTSAFTFTGSTETPANTNTTTNPPVALGAADWTVISTNAAFAAVIGSSNSSIVGVTFR